MNRNTVTTELLSNNVTLYVVSCSDGRERRFFSAQDASDWIATIAPGATFDWNIQGNDNAFIGLDGYVGPRGACNPVRQ